MLLAFAAAAAHADAPRFANTKTWRRNISVCVITIEQWTSTVFQSNPCTHHYKIPKASSVARRSHKPIEVRSPWMFITHAVCDRSWKMIWLASAIRTVCAGTDDKTMGNRKHITGILLATSKISHAQCVELLHLRCLREIRNSSFLSIPIRRRHWPLTSSAGRDAVTITRSCRSPLDACEST